MTRGTTSFEDRQIVEVFLENISIELDGSIILDWIADNFAPEDVFEEEQLAYWAEMNGFIQEE